MTDEKKVKEINGAKKHIHDKIGKSLFFDNIRGWVLWLIGLVSRKDSWANLMVDEPIQNEFVLPYPTITSVRLDFISTLKYESEFSRDNESKTYLLMIETDQKGLSKNLIKYFKYMATVIEKKFLNSKETTKIQVLFCVIFGTNVIPTEKDMMFASEFSNNMIRIEFIYLSQTDVDELLSSCKIKLKKGKVPSLLDFLKLMYLADLTDKHEQQSKKRAKTGKTLCESAFKVLIECKKLVFKNKVIDNHFNLNFSDIFMKLLGVLYDERLTPDQIAIFYKEEAMKSYREMSLTEAVEQAEQEKYNAFIEKRNAQIAQKALEKAEKKAEKEREKAKKEREKAEKEREKVMTMEESQAKTARFLLSQGTPRKTILNLFNITDTKLKSYEKTRP